MTLYPDTIQDPTSIVFLAACNEAVDVAMRPIRSRVVYRLAQLFGPKGPDGKKIKQRDELNQLFADTRRQAERTFLDQSLPSTDTGALVDSKFVELIGKDPVWKALVLEQVVQERRWSDLWKSGFEFAKDRAIAFCEKLVSPEHPVAKGTTGALTSIVAAVFAIWLPTLIKPDLYKNIHIPVQITFQGDGKNVPVTVSINGPDKNEIKLRAVLDPKADPNDLRAVIRPAMSPDAVTMNLKPSIEAPVKFTPEIQCPPGVPGIANRPGEKPCEIPVHFVPAGELSLFAKSLWDPKSPIHVSVQELNPISLAEPQRTGVQDAKPSKVDGASATSDRPLDQIGSNLATLNANLETLGGDLQASNGNGKSNLNLAALQVSQNRIHSTAVNQDRATVVEAKANSVHSVVLQWFDGALDPQPQSCTVKFKVENVTADKIRLSGIREVCPGEKPSEQALAKDYLEPEVGKPVPMALGLGRPTPLDQWNVSIDETHRRWAFLHAATLRFTWQPSPQVDQTIAQKTPATGSK